MTIEHLSGRGVGVFGDRHARHPVMQMHIMEALQVFLVRLEFVSSQQKTGHLINVVKVEHHIME
jgi:hypothetical protein